MEKLSKEDKVMMKKMRKIKNKHNASAREIVKTVIDTSEQHKISVNIINNHSYDESNPLVLPSKKRKTKKIQIKQEKKLLSKKKRKALEKIIERKKKKVQRAGLLEALQKVQTNNKDIVQNLISLQSIQTLGRKRYRRDDFLANLLPKKLNGDVPLKLNPNKGSKRGMPQLSQKDMMKKRKLEAGIQLVMTSSSSEEEEEDATGTGSSNLYHTATLNQSHDKETTVTEALDKDTSSNSTDNTADTLCNHNKNTTSHNNDEKFDVKTESNLNISQRIGKPFMLVNRTEEVQKMRSKLPVVSNEYEIMSAIHENTFVVIVGATGSGKTTQVPQFLLEAGFANESMIGITEPRRVAAKSMSKRVAYELNMSEEEVSYQVRYEGNVTPKTKIKFMTDGLMMKELEEDIYLKKYSAIIIDEAHERSVHSDILLGVLSRIALKRGETEQPLKVIIMSATMQEEIFTNNKNLFPVPPPVVKVESRMFDVAVHFNRKTNVDYVSEAYKKICRIHTQLPPGGILIFLTGKDEILKLCEKLRKAFPKIRKSKEKEKELNTKKNCNRRKIGNCKKAKEATELPTLDLDQYKEASKIENETIKTIKPVEPGTDDTFDLESDIELEEEVPKQPMHVLPFYAKLSAEKQMEVFKGAPDGCRLCVIATNVAETSITIPEIVYVVDSGKVKQKIYNPHTGISTMKVTWISQASAEQRKGRAGRVQPGHCYRLYSSAVYNLMIEHTIPEISRRSIDDVVLSMKVVRARVLSFPYITSPAEEQLTEALKHLKQLGALMKPESKKYCTLDEYKLTQCGKYMSRLPVAPRYAKMLIESAKYKGLSEHFILLVCCLSVEELISSFPRNSDNLDKSNPSCDKRLKWIESDAQGQLGDLMLMMEGVYRADLCDNEKEKRFFCEDFGIRYKALEEIYRLQKQLTDELNSIFPQLKTSIPYPLKGKIKKSCDPNNSPRLEKLSDQLAWVMRRIVLSGSFNRIARLEGEEKYKLISSGEEAFLHNRSVFMQISQVKPYYICYQEIYKNNEKNIVYGVSSIDSKWIAELFKDLCDYSDPLEDPPPRYDCKKDSVVCHQNVTFGPYHWAVRKAEFNYPYIPKLYNYVAFFILNGHICPKLQKYSKDLLNINSFILPKAIRYFIQRKNFIDALMNKEVYSLKRLRNIWKENPSYLLSEYLEFMPGDERKFLRIEIKALWPPCDLS